MNRQIVYVCPHEGCGFWRLRGRGTFCLGVPGQDHPRRNLEPEPFLVASQIQAVVVREPAEDLPGALERELKRVAAPTPLPGRRSNRHPT